MLSVKFHKSSVVAFAAMCGCVGFNVCLFVVNLIVFHYKKRKQKSTFGESRPYWIVYDIFSYILSVDSFLTPCSLCDCMIYCYIVSVKNSFFIILLVVHQRFIN